MHPYVLHKPAMDVLRAFYEEALRERHRCENELQAAKTGGWDINQIRKARARLASAEEKVHETRTDFEAAEAELARLMGERYVG